MAVYHCRCAFLCYFLLHKQKKEYKTFSFCSLLKNYVLFALMQMGNPKDYEKKIIRRGGPPAGQANAHEHSNKL